MAKRVQRITKRVVDHSVPGTNRYFVWDSELKGLGLKVETTGTKTYFVRYRPRGLGSSAPKRFVTIGRHGHITPDEARARARAMFGAVAAGEDPANQIARSKAALTFSELITVFLRDHVDAKRKATTGVDYRSLLRRHVLPALGSIKAERVTRTDVARLHLALRGRAPRANRVISVISSIYGFASRQGLVPDGYNPARGIERYREQARERFLTADELKRLGDALRDAETIGLPWDVDADGANAKHLARPENRRTILEAAAVAAIRLLILTGARVREILDLKWEHVDLERGLAFLPDSKTGRKTLVFSTAAEAVLRTLSRDGSFVIAGRLPDEARVDLKRPWQAVRRAARLDGVRLHDLRHTFASVGAGASLGLPIVGKLLGHTQAQTTARYSHLDASPLRRAADLIGSHLTAAMQGDRAKSRDELPTDGKGTS